MDLGAVEAALRAAVLGAGASVLEEILTRVGVGRHDAPLWCSCGCRMVSRGVKYKWLLTLLGYVRFGRSLFVCPRCRAVRFPGDEALGVVGTSRSPGVLRLVALFAYKEPFKEVSKDLREAAGLSISPKDAERIAEDLGEEMETWMALTRLRARHEQEPQGQAGPAIEHLYIEFDGTGVPMVPAALAGRKGKQPDGSAKTREVKLGCVFTQTLVDAQGRPVRDPASTSFVGAIEEAHAFGSRIYDEAVRRGLYRARHVTVLTDAAEWTKNIAGTYFPMARHTIDFYHGCEHMTELAKAIHPSDTALAHRHAEQWTSQLYEGKLQTVIEAVRDLLPTNQDSLREARRELAYFSKNAERMQYDEYRGQGEFIGSGVIEAGCKNVVGARLKQSGMEWAERGANAIVALRCGILSNRFEDFWEYRATPNNALTYAITTASNIA